MFLNKWGEDELQGKPIRRHRPHRINKLKGPVVVRKKKASVCNYDDNIKFIILYYFKLAV